MRMHESAPKNFIADLHIHSRFSRATSKALNPRHLAAWARCKGIHVLGTGDFTHPQWRAELAEQLQWHEASGLYCLKGRPEALDVLPDPASWDQADDSSPLFLLQTEISSIYKRHGSVHKVHNLLFVPTLEDAERLSLRLSRIGNLASDGRPILGLDSRDLLELLLDCVPEGVLIPAHIWTPWFSVFGSKSGFDSLEACFADLTSHIFALETGLSSDPAMNRLVSSLDKYALVSNSDAHSGANLGREANLFWGHASYHGIFTALRRAALRETQEDLPCRFLGTVEFYPDEGKYHLDGHRACHVVLDPREALSLGNICPVCGKPLTVGVLHRVLELADRESSPQLNREPLAQSIIPLAEVVAEILGVGVTSRKVHEQYMRILRDLGPELHILYAMEESLIRRYWEPLGEAVARMRQGTVWKQGGYDGTYGVVRVFSPEEQADIRSPALPGLRRGRLPQPVTAKPASQSTPSLRTRHQVRTAAPNESPAESDHGTKKDHPLRFSREQDEALHSGPEPVLVLAGPGTGKTRVLVGRLCHLLRTGVDPSRILAITFTRRAAQELRERLLFQFPEQEATRLPACDTFHGFAWKALCRQADKPPLLLSEEAAKELFAMSNPHFSTMEAQQLWDRYALSREKGEAEGIAQDSTLALAAANYQRWKSQEGQNYYDYADLLEWWLRYARQLPENQRPLHLLVDEIQDLSPCQHALVRTLLPKDGRGFFGIGDPDQAIYSFRGADGHTARRLRAQWPTCKTYPLAQSYRASQRILDMAHSLWDDPDHAVILRAVHDFPAEIRLHTAHSAQSEAGWIASQVQQLLGSTSHSLRDIQSSDALHGLAGTLAPGDMAVLVRMKAQIPPLRAALEKFGIPVAAPAEDAFTQDSTCSLVLACITRHCLCEGTVSTTDFAHADRDIPDSWPEHWKSSLNALPPPQDMEAWLHAQPWAGTVFTRGNAWHRLCHMWKDCGSWNCFFETLAWQREEESVRSKAEQVQIMTLHASKGLEFEAVFLPGLEEGILPLRRDILFLKDTGDASSLDEEKRLFYVGLTRAAKALFLSHASQRRLYGTELRLAPSRFLQSVQEFCSRSHTEAPQKPSQQLTLF